MADLADRPTDAEEPPGGLKGVQTGVGVIATVLVGFSLWALRHLLTPLALAAFLLLLIDGLARAIKARAPRFPPRLATPAAIIFVVGVFVLAIWLVADNGADFASQKAAYATRLNAVLQTAATRLDLQATPTVRSLWAGANPGRLVSPIAHTVRSLGEGAVFVLIYLGFLLASRRGFEAKGRQLFQNPGRRAEAGRVVERIRRGVESYIWVQTVVGMMITAASAVIMLALGLTHVAFWCFIIFLANYIPAIGAAIGVILPPLFGLVDMPDLWRPILMLALLEAVHFSVSHVVQPRMQGKNLNLDPIVVLLALTFWGLLWGLTGALLSTPLTVVAMAILSEFRGTRPIAVLLSSDGKPFAEDTTRRPQR